MTPHNKKYDTVNFLEAGVSRGLLALNIFLAAVYFVAIVWWFPSGNPVLFWLLVFGEIFHLWQLLTYIYTVWNTEHRTPFDPNYTPPVDVFITVAGEPVDIVEETVRAALAMDYPKFSVYVLNDGYVAKKENWRDIEMMAARLGAECITRKVPGGAKAGNINNGLSLTRNPLVAVFDADHVPHGDFLRKMTGYFADRKMGFVQSPQYYKNYDTNEVTQGSWEQQALFFGPICKGKNRLNSVTMCGTNMVIRREALLQVGGICTESIAEDFVTGLFIHEKGWKSCYVPEVLAEGLAPEDFLSYYKQQFRWARGSMDVLFRYNFLLRRGLTFGQKVQYLSSVSYFLSGVVVIMNALIPIIFFFTGLVPLQISTMSLAALFLPYIFVTIYALQASVNFCYSFKSLAFSMAGFHIHLSALWANIIGKKSAFSVTSKKGLRGNFIHLVIPHIVYVGLVVVGIGYGIVREGFTPSLITNIAWAVLNTAIFAEFISAALPQNAFEVRKKVEPAISN
jgi:cellulose synthase (UDP-forming)